MKRFRWLGPDIFNIIDAATKIFFIGLRLLTQFSFLMEQMFMLHLKSGEKAKFPH